MRELAERAVACKHWRWMEGMGIRIGDWIVERCVEVGARGPAYRDGYGRLTVVQLALPALDDPATLGCLRHLAAKAHGAWDIVIQVDIAPRMEGTHGWWRAIDSRGRKIPGAFGTFVCPNDGTDIKVHALVKALEAAP